MDLKNTFETFIEQSQRIISITTKPKPQAYRQMAMITGIGAALIGLAGFLISMIVYFTTRAR